MQLRCTDKRAQGVCIPVGYGPEQRGGDGRIPGKDDRHTSSPCSINIEDVIGYDALWESMEKCKRGVLWKGSVASFWLNAAETVKRLCDDLHSGRYRPGKPTVFEVTSPKRRTIVGIPFRDRVYQRSLNDNLVYPLMSKSWIHDNAACQVGKGTDFARMRFKHFIGSHYRKYDIQGACLSMDIRKYYDNLRHDHVLSVFRRYLPEWGMNMVMNIFEYQYPGNTGFYPGSQLVQIAGISALSDTDHFIKEQLHAKRYIRYMDDLRIIADDLGYLRWCREAIADHLRSFGLRLHPEKTLVRLLTDDNPFLGFNFRLTGTGKVMQMLDPKSPKMTRRKLSRLHRLQDEGLRPSSVVLDSYGCWRAHASKGDSRTLIDRMDIWLTDMSREGMETYGYYV